MLEMFQLQCGSSHIEVHGGAQRLAADMWPDFASNSLQAVRAALSAARGGKCASGRQAGGSQFTTEEEKKTRCEAAKSLFIWLDFHTHLFSHLSRAPLPPPPPGQHGASGRSEEGDKSLASDSLRLRQFCRSKVTITPADKACFFFFFFPQRLRISSLSSRVIAALCASSSHFVLAACATRAQGDGLAGGGAAHPPSLLPPANERSRPVRG